MHGSVRVKRGISLGITLMVLGILSTLALTLVAVSVHNLNVTTRLDSLEEARNLAESSIALGIEEILKHPEFGRTRDPAEQLEVHPKDSQALGTIVFSKGDSRLAYSTNNLE